MLSLDEIRKTLPPECKDWSDERVKKLSDQMDQLADVLFDMWLAEQNKEKLTLPLRCHYGAIGTMGSVSPNNCCNFGDDL